MGRELEASAAPRAVESRVQLRTSSRQKPLRRPPSLIQSNCGPS